jgi:hypothetical protein
VCRYGRSAVNISSCANGAVRASVGRQGSMKPSARRAGEGERQSMDLIVEDKEDMKKRGLASPDLADARL